MSSPIKEVQAKHNPVDAGQHQAAEIATAAGKKLCEQAYETPKNSFSMGMLDGVNRTFGASSEGTRVAKAEPSSLEVTPISTVISAQRASGAQPDAAARQAADAKFDEMVA